MNAAGCLWAMIVGFLMGLFRLAVDTGPKVSEGFTYAEGSFFWVVNKIYFQYFSLLIFLFSAWIMIVVSYATREPEYEKICGLTFGTLTEQHRSETRRSWSALDVVASLGVVALIVAAYIYFSG